MARRESLQMAEVSLKRLQELLVQLDEVCRQAREIQRSVKQTLADSRRRDRQDLGVRTERRKTARSK